MSIAVDFWQGGEGKGKTGLVVVVVVLLSEVRVGCKEDRADPYLAFSLQFFLLNFTFTCLLTSHLGYHI